MIGSPSFFRENLSTTCFEISHTHTRPASAPRVHDHARGNVVLAKLVMSHFTSTSTAQKIFTLFWFLTIQSTKSCHHHHHESPHQLLSTLHPTFIPKPGSQLRQHPQRLSPSAWRWLRYCVETRHSQHQRPQPKQIIVYETAGRTNIFHERSNSECSRRNPSISN